MLSSLHFEDIIRFGPLLFEGFKTTLMLAFTVIVTSFCLGMGIAILRFYRVAVLDNLCGFYVYFVRSIPLIMLIALIHFAILPALGVRNSFFLSAYIGLSLSTTAYLAEIFRGGFQAIRKEELETAVSLGFNTVQQLIYIHVPLVVSRMMPAMINQFVTLIKDTSLASIIGVIELTRAAEISYERTLHEATLLIFIAVVYFGLCYSLSKFSHRLEAHALQ